MNLTKLLTYPSRPLIRFLERRFGEIAPLDRIIVNMLYTGSMASIIYGIYNYNKLGAEYILIASGLSFGVGVYHQFIQPRNGKQIGNAKISNFDS